LILQSKRGTSLEPQCVYFGRRQQWSPCSSAALQSPANGDAAVGVGIICNASQQAEQFVRLRSTGAEPERAMHAVNANAHDERARERRRSAIRVQRTKAALQQ
jgi:hypothetical protein